MKRYDNDYPQEKDDQLEIKKKRKPILELDDQGAYYMIDRKGNVYRQPPLDL